MWAINAGNTAGASGSAVSNVLAVVRDAADYWGRYIDFGGATLDITVNIITLDADALAQAGTSFTFVGGNLFQADTILELQTGLDQNGAESDIEIDVNLTSILVNEFFFGGPDGAGPPSNLFDLFTILVHEIGHGLGFLSFLDVPETAVFDTFVSGPSEARIFSGPNAIAAFGGPVPMDSDPSHLAESLGQSQFVMTPSLGPGERIFLSAVDVAILEDAGLPILAATEASDRLFGFPSADTASLLAGDDFYTALAGDDSIAGDAGDDTIDGGDGSDTLAGGNGDDTLLGGGGDDQLFAGFGDDRADGGAGADLILSGPGKDTLLGGEGNDTLGASNRADLLRGEGGNDLMLGSNGNDRLFGGADNDTLLGGNGRDTLSGDAGADRLVGGNQADTASYEAAGAGVSANLATGSGSAGEALGDVLIDIENLSGSAFADTLDGSGGVNRLAGGAGKDALDGLGGNDQIIGGAGDDTLTGGAGNDAFVFFSNAPGADAITDFTPGAGTDDVIRLFGFGAAFNTFAEVQAAASQVGADTVIDFGGGNSITLAGVAAGDLHADDFLFG